MTTKDIRQRFKVTPAMKADLDRIAQKWDITKSELLRDSIRRYLEHEDFYDQIYLNNNSFDPKAHREFLETQIYGERENNELEPVEVREARNGEIVVASSSTVTKKLVEKGYERKEITECPRLKQGLEFAWGIDQYLEELSPYDHAILDGTVREGITTVLRRLRFAEPLRHVVKKHAEERGVQVFLRTDKRSYRLADDLDFADMLREAIHTTWDGRISQAKNRPQGFSEYLQMCLTVRSMPLPMAIDEVISNMKANGSYKPVEDIEAFSERFCKRMTETYNKTHLAGYPMMEFENVLIKELESLEVKADEFEICPMEDCSRRISKNDIICKRCQRATLEAN